MTPRLPAKPGRLSDAISSHLHKESRPSLLTSTNASVIVTADTTYRGLDDIRGFFRRFLDSATPEFRDALCRRWGSDGRIAKTDVALRGMRHQCSAARATVKSDDRVMEIH